MIGTEVSHSSLSPKDRIDLIHHFSESVANGTLRCVYPLSAYCFRPFHLGLQVQPPTIRGEWGCGCAFLWFDLDPVTLDFKICLVDSIFSNCKVQEVQTCCVQTCYVHPLGVDILFLLFPPSGVPASHLVSRHFR